MHAEGLLVPLPLGAPGALEGLGCLLLLQAVLPHVHVPEVLGREGLVAHITRVGLRYHRQFGQRPLSWVLAFDVLVQ